MFKNFICRNRLPQNILIKNPRNPRKSWLAILDEIRKKDREDVLSQTEALKQLDMKEMEELSKQNYFVYK